MLEKNELGVMLYEANKGTVIDASRHCCFMDF